MGIAGTFFVCAGLKILMTRGQNLSAWPVVSTVTRSVRKFKEENEEEEKKKKKERKEKIQRAKMNLQTS